MKLARIERARVAVQAAAPAPLPVEQARALLPDRDDVEKELYEQWADADQRAAARNPPRRPGHLQPICPGCRLFTANASAPHGCGWIPGRGHA